MPSLSRKLAGLSRRLLCLPRRSDVDLADSLPVHPTATDPLKDDRLLHVSPETHTEVSPAANARSETQDVVTQSRQDIANASSPVDALHDSALSEHDAILHRTSRSSSLCSEEQAQETSFPGVPTFTRKPLPSDSRNLRSTSPLLHNPSTEQGNKSVTRELSQLVARSPAAFVSTWRKDMQENCQTHARKDPHLFFLVLMGACAVESHFILENFTPEDLWADMMLSGVADACTTYLRKYPVAKMVRFMVHLLKQHTDVRQRMTTGLSNVVLCLQTACVPPENAEAARASFMALFAQYWKSIWENKKLLTEDDVEGIGESASKARQAVHAAISMFFSVLW